MDITQACCWLRGSNLQGYPLSQEQAFMLSKEALEKFKEIWKKEKGEELSDEFSVEAATHLLTLFDAIYRPIRKD